MTIKTTNIADIKDQRGINDVEFKVNFDKDEKDLIRIAIQDKTSYIKRSDLWNFVFTIVKADQQAQMIPVVKTEMVQYLKQHTVELQKDMKKGEILAVNCKVNVRKEIDEAIRREIEEEKLSTPSPYLQENKKL